MLPVRRLTAPLCPTRYSHREVGPTALSRLPGSARPGFSPLLHPLLPFLWNQQSACSLWNPRESFNCPHSWVPDRLSTFPFCFPHFVFPLSFPPTRSSGQDFKICGNVRRDFCTQGTPRHLKRWPFGVWYFPIKWLFEMKRAIYSVANRFFHGIFWNGYVNISLSRGDKSCTLLGALFQTAQFSASNPPIFLSFSQKLEANNENRSREFHVLLWVFHMCQSILPLHTLSTGQGGRTGVWRKTTSL